MKAYNVRNLSPELHHALKLAACRAGITMERLIICLLEDGLKRLNNGKGE